MSVEEDLMSLVEDTLIDTNLGGNEIHNASKAIVEGVRDLVGVTQEKLMLDLSIARSAQRAAEGREQALEDTCADLYRQLARLNQERLDASRK